MACPILMFYLLLNSNHWRLDVITFQDLFFQDICKPTSCLHHLIPPARDTSITTRLRLTNSLPRSNLGTKNYCSFINFGLHHYQPTQWLLTHSTHLSQRLCTYMHIVCFICWFIYYFNCINLLSGSRATRLLLNWLIDNSRTERPRKTKIGTQIAHVIGDSHTTCKVKRSTCWFFS